MRGHHDWPAPSFIQEREMAYANHGHGNSDLQSLERTVSNSNAPKPEP